MVTNMQKSIFIKYFSLCAGTIIVSITILGAILLVFVSRHFEDEKRELLLQNAEQVAVEAAERYEQDGALFYGGMRPVLRIYADAVDASFFLAGADGGVLETDGSASYVKAGKTVPPSVMGKLGGQPFYELGNLDGLYGTSYYTVAVPVSVEGRVSYYIFASMCVTVLYTFLHEIFRMFLLASIAVIAGVFVVVYFLSLSMVMPLREMSVAAQQFGQGDFSKRIPVSGNDEMGQLARSLNEMASSLSALESMRRSFVANVSHELKTPMTTIGGFIDGILDGTIPKAQQAQYLTIVSGEIKRLSRLVRSMLNLSKIESGEFSLQKGSLDLVDAVCKTVFTFEQPINEKRIDIRGLDNPKVVVECDADLMRQVIYNLIENAVKFVNEDGRIDFSFTVGGGQTTVSIRNTGPGLSREELPLVFERFYKTDKSRGLDQNGAGLGLHIVRTILELHGGDIHVDSVPGDYTSFTFTIPTGSPHQTEKPKKQGNV